jgi:hypothetical protein
MQLFSFGHPCEHQLRRTCIGGSSCPLHGYPDSWCCSYVKGKINFKRDKPCEGPRCRWGFTHPTQAQFDAVTLVIAEGKAIGANLDESGPNDLLTFQIDSTHVVDTVQCALHVMKHPPSSCGKKIGQLLAYAAIKAQEVKVFTQLLKTMKKPIDAYLLGAMEHLSNLLKVGTPVVKKGKKDDALIEDLRSDIVDVMSAALSQGGQLVIRDDQRELQQVYISALKSFVKNRKKLEMLELAQAKFKFSATALPVAVPAAAPAPPCIIDTPELPPALPLAQPKISKQEAAKAEELKAAAATAASSPALGSAATTAAVKKAEVLPVVVQQVNKRVIAISKRALSFPMPTEPRKYAPLHRVDDDILQDVLILGGLLSLSSKSSCLLGSASKKSPVAAASPSDGNSPLRLLAEHGPSILDTKNEHHGVRHNAPHEDHHGFGIFGSDAPVSFASSHTDQSLLEGVMHAWGH